MEKSVLLTFLLLIGSSDGFGCPLDQYQCDLHCRFMGCAAGYCGIGFLKFRCICARCNGQNSICEGLFEKQCESETNACYK